MGIQWRTVYELQKTVCVFYILIAPNPNECRW